MGFKSQLCCSCLTQLWETQFFIFEVGTQPNPEEIEGGSNFQVRLCPVPVMHGDCALSPRVMLG
jgi:hypothetical protein